MVGIQLGLIDTTTGAALVEPEEIYTEDEYSFRQMTEIAKNYGKQLGTLEIRGKLTEKELNQRIFGFVEGMSAVRPLSTDERQWLRDDVLTASQAWTEPS